MMSGPFKPMFPDWQFSSPVVWEATRWTARQNGAQRRFLCFLRNAPLPLPLRLQYGVEQFVAIFEAPMRRMYRKCGMSPKVLATIGSGPYRGISARICNVAPENEEEVLRAIALESPPPISVAA